MGKKIIGAAGRVVGPKGSWQRRWAMLLSLLIALGLTVVLKQTVFAVHGTGAFQLDGDASRETNTAGVEFEAVDDWDNVCYQVAVAPTSQGGLNLSPAQATAKCFKYLTPPALGGPTTGGATAVAWSEETNAASSIFTGGGSKDPEFISEWLWKDDANNPPDKDNLIHAYAARYSLTPSDECPSITPTCEVLFFGSDRFDNSGDAQQAFWFFQSKILATQNKKQGGLAFSGEHRPGDVLVISNFSNGGTTSTITVYKWDPVRPVDPPTVPATFTGCVATNKAVNPTNPKQEVSDTTCADKNLRLLANLEGAPAKCTTAADNDAACGIVNPELITMPWTFLDKTPTPNDGAINGEFYEAGLNLSALNLGDECFSSVVAETRSSTSTTAVLKDFVVGQLGSCETTLTTTAQFNAAGTSIISSATGNGTASSGTDTAVLTIKGVSTWGGTLQFYICGPFAAPTVCTADGVLVTSRVISNASPASDYISGTATLTSAGRYCWFARFTPDTLTAAKGVIGAEHNGTPTPPATNNLECFVVSPVAPTLGTSVAAASVTFGNPTIDTPSLTGLAKEPGNNGGNKLYPTINATNGAFAGIIAFRLKGPEVPPACSTTDAVAKAGSTPTAFPINVAVTGNGTAPTLTPATVQFTPASPGKYHWVATYSGPGANGTAVNNVASLMPFTALPVTHNADCSDTLEDVTVQQIPTSITTSPWTFPNDSATITSSDGNLPSGGTIVFKLFGETALGQGDALANCQAGGSVTTPGQNGLRYIQTFNSVANGSTTSVTRDTSNGPAAGGLPAGGFQITSLNSGDYYWRVTFAAGNTTHTGIQSACVERTSVTQIASAGPGTAFP